MRNFLLGAALAFVVAFGIKYFIDKSTIRKTELESSDLILTQIKNVVKLVVTEGHFAEVITYKDDKKYYLDLLTATKKAIVEVNAHVQVSYDLSTVEHHIDNTTKTVVITKIPKAEININPTIKYHDLQADFFNQFIPDDHNLIREKVKKQLEEKVKKSTLVTNSQDRLISELQKLYILTNSLGWTLKYNNTIIETPANLKQFID